VKDLARARDAARALAGVPVEEVVVLSDANSAVLLLRPGDVVVRVAPADRNVAAFEIEVARRLGARGAPVIRLDPRVEARVHAVDGFVLTFWTHHAPLPGPTPPAEYARALRRFHTAAAGLDVEAPSFTDRVRSAVDLLSDPVRTPDLGAEDRELLLTSLRGATEVVSAAGREQLLHGEPHAGNVLHTAEGVLFLDFETCCRGPVEYDLAYVPDAVAELYPDADPEVLRASRILMFAMITTWRWDRDDQFPDGMSRAAEWTRELHSLLG
jgi:Ser/Thr protein kinase RdoA (MazF antagonist)